MKIIFLLERNKDLRIECWVGTQEGWFFSGVIPVLYSLEVPCNKILFPHHVSTECRVLSTDFFHLSGCVSGWINKKSSVKIASTIYCTKLPCCHLLMAPIPFLFLEKMGIFKRSSYLLWSYFTRRCSSVSSLL